MSKTSSVPKRGVYPLLRCPYCVRRLGTISLDVDVALGAKPAELDESGTPLIVYGTRDAKGKSCPCPHLIYLSIDIYQTTPKGGWLGGDEAHYGHPLALPQPGPAAQAGALWYCLQEHVCFPDHAADRAQWSKAIEQPFYYFSHMECDDETAEAFIKTNQWEFQQQSHMLVALDVPAFLNEVIEIMNRDNPTLKFPRVGGGKKGRHACGQKR